MCRKTKYNCKQGRYLLSRHDEDTVSLPTCTDNSRADST